MDVFRIWLGRMNKSSTKGRKARNEGRKEKRKEGRKGNLRN